MPSFPLPPHASLRTLVSFLSLSEHSKQVSSAPNCLGSPRPNSEVWESDWPSLASAVVPSKAGAHLWPVSWTRRGWMYTTKMGLVLLPCLRWGQIDTNGLSRYPKRHLLPFGLSWGLGGGQSWFIFLPSHFSAPSIFRGKVSLSGIPVPPETPEDSGRV